MFGAVLLWAGLAFGGSMAGVTVPDSRTIGSENREPQWAWTSRKVLF